MKKYFIWIMIIGAILTISCDNMIPATAENESPAQNQSEQKAYLSVSLEQQTGRSILPQDNTVLEDLSYDLSGVRNGKEQNFGEFSYSELLNLRCEIMMGTWDFTLLAKRNGYLVLSGSVSGKTISVGNNSIAFTLHEAEDGVGDVAVRIRCPRNGAAAVCAILQNLSDGEEANRQVFTLSDCSDDAEKSEAVYKVSNLQKGFYRLYVRLYQNENDTTPINSQVVMVRVGAGCLSAGTMSFDTLNNYYTIIYHIGDMDLTADYILPTKYTVWDQINLPDESLFNVSNGEIVYGWYDNAALTGEQAVLIDYDSTGDREYWLDYKTIDDVFRTSVEHLAEVLARFKPLCGPYHVIITDSNPSLSSVKDLLQANPTLRINLDLSECGGLTSIGDSAFYGCSGLTSVTIPVNVRSIGGLAFCNCSGLTRVDYTGTIADWCDISFSAEYANPLCYAHNLYIDGKLVTDLIIPDTVTEIKEYTFRGGSCFKNIVIPNSVSSIASGAFSGCSNLECITIPFIGNKANTPDDIYQYPFGYIFGTGRYTGGIEAFQTYHNNILGSDYDKPVSYYIPAMLKTVIVTGGEYILYGAFSNCSSLMSITIPNSVIHILNKSFIGCSGLTSVGFIGTIEKWCELGCGTNFPNPYSLYINEEIVIDLIIPDTVIEIKNATFKNCSSLTSVTISNSVTSIGEIAFKNCSSLTSVTIGNGVTSIASNAFQDCNGLTSINVDANNTIYDSRNNCNAIIETSTNKLIRGCNNTVIPNGVTSIGRNAFQNCSGLNNIEIPDSVTSIGQYTFSGCSGLTSITIPNSVTSIGIETFRDCSGLTSVTIPDSVTSISRDAFNGCIGLTSITIPDSLTSIDSGAFSNCPAIRYASLDSDGAKALSKAGYSFRPIGANYDLKYLYSGDEISGIELASVDKDITSFTMPNNVTSIAESVFSGCDKLTSITIPFVGLSPTATGDNARFYKIFGSDISAIPPSLKEVIITGGTSIGEYAFKDCGGLTNVTISDSVTNIGQKAFYNCSGLTSMRIPNGVTSIGQSAFYNCSGLTSVTIPNGVTSIGEGAFYNCNGLTSVTIPDSVTSIGNYAFRDCGGLISITLPSIGSFISLFYDGHYVPKSLKDVILTSGTSIGDKSFYACIDLASITIPDSISSVGASAFDYCDAVRYARIDSDGAKALSKAGYSFRQVGTKYDLKYLYSGDEIIGLEISNVDKDITSLIIPNGVTTINQDAFLNCTGLTSVMIPDSVTSIGMDAFHNCSGLTSITIPDSVTSIYSQTFEGCINLKEPVYNAHIFAYMPKSYSGEYTVLDSVKTICGGSFYGCNGLTGLTIPFVGGSAEVTEASNTTLFGYIFAGILSYDGGTSTKQYYSTSSYATFYIPSSLKSVTVTGGSLKYGTFYNCSGLNSITIGENVTSIGECAFYNCPATKYAVMDSDGAKALGKAGYSFRQVGTNYDLKYLYSGDEIIGLEISNVDKDITSLTMPNGVTSIGSNAFNGCNGLTSVTIPDSVTSIGGSAFSGCSGLTSVTIPDSVTSIGGCAFRNCSGLTRVDYTGTIADWCDISFGDEWSNPLYYAHNLYINGGIVTDLVIPNTVTEIKQYAFRGCSNLTSLTIPDSVTSIGIIAFFGCHSITSVTIESDADFSSTGLYFTKDNINYNVLNKSSVFISITSYSGDVVIPTTVTAGNTFSVTSIGERAFQNCNGLTSVTIPKSVMSIGEGAFNNCSVLTTLNVKATTPPTFGSYMLAGCSALTTIYVPTDSVDAYKAASGWSSYADKIEGKEFE